MISKQLTILILETLLVITAIASKKQPNILIFFVDDFGWGDFGANMGKQKVDSNTPNMDEFSRTGIRFTDFHVASSVCSPSRASLLTGRLGMRNGVNTLFGPTSVGGLPLTELTLAEMLKQHNYQTFAVGKWHLGHNGSYHPVERGFDHYFGVPYSLDSGCLDNAGYIHPARKSCKEAQNWVGLPIYKDKKVVEQPLKLEDLSNLYVEEFQERINELSKTSRPFFGYIPFSHLHVPLGIDQQFSNSSSTIFGDTVRELDSSFQRMIEHLKITGMVDDTWIWLMGDNGPWESQCQYGGSPGPYQGHWQKKYGGGGTSWKLTVWEGGHRVPAFVSWPTKISSNQVFNGIFSSLDVLPTITNYLGINLPTDRQYDGKDISHTLFNGAKSPTEVLFHPRSFHPQNGNITAVRYKNYKAIFESGGPSPLLDCQLHAGPLLYHNPPLLFDLTNDPGEENALDIKTNPKYEVIVNQIIKLREEKLLDIKRDKRSTVDTTHSNSVKPCCNHDDPICRCKKQGY